MCSVYMSMSMSVDYIRVWECTLCIYMCMGVCLYFREGIL